MQSYNKFHANQTSKLGAEIRNASNLSNIMKAGLSGAIPIWEMLNLTEEEYNIQYNTRPTDASNNSVDASNNDISGNAVDPSNNDT